MELQSLWAPFCGAALVGMSVLQFSGPEAARPKRVLWPWAWGGLALIAGVTLAVQLGGLSVVWGTAALPRVLGSALCVVAAVAAHVGTRHRSRGEALVANAPMDVDDAVSALRRGASVESLLIRGRLGAREQVTSPGGVVCAFYDAELRAVTDDGGRGTLLSRESGGARRLFLRGERFEVEVDREAVGVVAPERIHRCRLGGDWALTDGELAPSAAPDADSLSYERVGKLGEPALVVGRLTCARNGAVVLRPAHGVSPLLVLSEDARAVGRAMARRAWGYFTAAALLCVGAAYLLGAAVAA